METALSDGEELVEDNTFTANLLLFWLKTKFTLTSKRVMSNSSNTLVGFIPVGKVKMTYPLKNIAGVVSSTEFHFKRLLIGGVLVYVSLALMENYLIGALCLLIFGTLPILNCYTSTLSITNNAGQTPLIEFSILEKSKVQAFADEVTSKIADL